MPIQSIDRAISVLNLFKNSKRPLGLAEIADSLGLVKTTVHTIVKTLEQNGFLIQDKETRRYKLGFGLLELGMIQAANLEINQQSAANLQQLAKEAGELCRVGIWESGSVLVTMHVDPQGLNTMTHQLGPRLPAYCSALGKAILANLPQQELSEYLDHVELRPYTQQSITDPHELMKELEKIRLQGYSVSNKELLPYQKALGAPVRKEGGELAGAISLLLDVEGLIPERLEISANRILKTAHEISMNMGYQTLG